MPSISVHGLALNDFVAEAMVKDFGAAVALNRTSGPMREAVERVILACGLVVDRSTVTPEIAKPAV